MHLLTKGTPFNDLSEGCAVRIKISLYFQVKKDADWRPFLLGLSGFWSISLRNQYQCQPPLCSHFIGMERGLLLGFNIFLIMLEKEYHVTVAAVGSPFVELSIIVQTPLSVSSIR